MYLFFKILFSYIHAHVVAYAATNMDCLTDYIIETVSVLFRRQTIMFFLCNIQPPAAASCFRFLLQLQELI